MVEFNPETRQLGLDVDEEDMIKHFPGRLGPGTYFAFRTAVDNRDASTKSERYDRARSGEKLWMNLGDALFETNDLEMAITPPRTVVNDLFTAFRRYGQAMDSRYISCKPPFDPNMLAYKNATASCEKVAKVMQDLTIIDAQLEATDQATGSQPTPG